MNQPRTRGEFFRHRSIPESVEFVLFDNCGFFTRAGMEDTNVGADKKDDPADVARDGFDSLMRRGRTVEVADRSPR